jgi:hypothetical protein
MFKVTDNFSEDFANPYLPDPILRLIASILRAILFDRANISE